MSLVPAVLASGLPALCQADVMSSGPTGFIVKIETPVAAAPAEVYSRFLQIGQWWSDEHTYSSKAANMTLENTPGGCFCELLPGGGFVRHAQVELSMPGQLIRLSGALGPLQEMGAYGLMDFRFHADGAKNKTRLELTYTVSGYQPGKGLGEIAAAVDGVMTEQMQRLKHLVETGKPAG